MSLRFDAEIANLAAAGITLNDLKGDEVEDLVHAIDRVHNPFREVNLDALGKPLYDRNGLILYPLTIGAVVWLEEYAKPWWGKQPRAYFWAVVFAMIHARERGVFSNLTDEDAAYEEVKRTGLELCVSEDEITEAVDIALDFNRPPTKRDDRQKDEEGTDWATVIAALETQSGIPAEKWIWQRSADYCVRAYHTLTKFVARQGGQKAARMQDELDRAMNYLAAVRSSIIDRINAERAKK